MHKCNCNIILHEALSLLHAEETINSLSDTHAQIYRIFPGLKNTSSAWLSEYHVRACRGKYFTIRFDA